MTVLRSSLFACSNELAEHVDDDAVGVGAAGAHRDERFDSAIGEPFDLPNLRANAR